MMLASLRDRVDRKEDLCVLRATTWICPPSALRSSSNIAFRMKFSELSFRNNVRSYSLFAWMSKRPFNIGITSCRSELMLGTAFMH